MDKKELAYIKQTLWAVRDWDGFQNALRILARLQRDASVVGERVMKKL